MSVQALSWVLECSTTKGADRLVLLSLANHANDEGECYPGVARIAREANLNEIHVRRCLKSLTDSGAISRQVNKAPDERIRVDRRPNLYRILDGCAQKCPPWLERVTLPRADGYDNDARTGSTSTRVTGTRGSATKPSVEPSEEPSVEPSCDSTSLALIEVAAVDPFDAFWNVYPRRTGKAEARKAWPKAIKVTGDPAALIAAAATFAADPNRVDTYTPHPATWLNQERWNDPPLPSRTGLSPTQAKERRSLEAIERAGAAATRNGFFSEPSDRLSLEANTQ